MAIDPTPIEGAAGLVKTTSISSDSQTTTMRTGADLRDLANFLDRDMPCDSQVKAMAGVFRFRAKPQEFRNLRQ